MLPVRHQYYSSTVSCVGPQEFSFQVDGAQNLRVLCVLQPEEGESCEDRVLCKTSIQVCVCICASVSRCVCSSMFRRCVCLYLFKSVYCVCVRVRAPVWSPVHLNVF